MSKEPLGKFGERPWECVSMCDCSCAHERVDGLLAEIERLTAENERLAAGRDAAIRTLADSRFPPVTRINDAIAILSRSGIVQQLSVNSEESK